MTFKKYCLVHIQLVFQTLFTRHNMYWLSLKQRLFAYLFLEPVDGPLQPGGDLHQIVFDGRTLPR